MKEDVLNDNETIRYHHQKASLQTDKAREHSMAGLFEMSPNTCINGTLKTNNKHDAEREHGIEHQNFWRPIARDKTVRE